MGGQFSKCCTTDTPSRETEQRIENKPVDREHIESFAYQNLESYRSAILQSRINNLIICLLNTTSEGKRAVSLTREFVHEARCA